jgi:hypothetical protein
MDELFEQVTYWPEWEKKAVAALNGRDKVEELEGQKMIYNDTKNTGHLYWWVDGLVACCPVWGDGKLDLGNVSCAGNQDGAEPDLYGRECLIGVKLAERFGAKDVTENYQALSARYFAEAERENCYFWGPKEIPPV